MEGVLAGSVRRQRICWPVAWALKCCKVGVCVEFWPFGAIATCAAVHASVCCGWALQVTALWGCVPYCSSKLLNKSALAERRNCVLLFAVFSLSASSAFRRPRFGRHSGSSARRARSSSGGTPSRILSASGSVVTGLSV